MYVMDIYEYQLTYIILTYTWFTNVGTAEMVFVTTEFCIVIQYCLESICKILINVLVCKYVVAARVTDTELENLSQYSD
jgi:hypothetical protein